MSHKLEVAFTQGNSILSKSISKVSKIINKDNYTGKFVPSHVLLILDNNIVFESSTYKKDDTKSKIFEKGTRILEVDDVDERSANNIVCRTTISDDCDAYLALKYVAKASNYHYSYKSIGKFITKGHLKADKGKRKDEYICSGLVLDALREPIFDSNKAIRKVTNKFIGIDSNSVTPLDLYLAMADAGFTFRQSKGLTNIDYNL